MGSQLENRLDEKLRCRAMRCALELISLQDEIWRRDMATEVNVKQVKLLNQGSQWLVVVVATVQGFSGVKMVTITDISQVGAAVLKMLTIEGWKADKFAKPLGPSKSGT